MKRITLASACLAVLVSAPYAPHASAAGNSVAIAHAAAPPTIDGVLDEAEWASATVIDGLRQVDPVEGAPAGQRTVIRVMQGPDALYVGAELHDDQPANVTAHVLSQGSSIAADDRFEVQVDPFRTRRAGYAFQLNPNGVRAQGLVQDITITDLTWNGIWQGAARRTADGWVAEMAIPYKSLSFDPASGSWGINFARLVQRTHETQSWTWYNRRYTPDNYGTATGLGGLRQGVGLDVTPTLVASTQHDDRAGTGHSQLRPSLTATWRVTPAITTSFTANTDFSATPADDRQVQLSRFSLFYPEKRDFFLQDADIFAFGGIQQNGLPWFSRRVGLGGAGQPLQLRVGGKVTARTSGLNVGLMDISQERDDGTVANLAVGRVVGTLGEHSTLGAIATSGNPLDGERSTLTGADYHYFDTTSWAGKTLEARAWLQHVDTSAPGGGGNAWSVMAGSPNMDGVQAMLQYTSIDAGFHPALGFVNRTGIRSTDIFAGYRHRPAAGPLQVFGSNAKYGRVTGTNGELQSESWMVQPLQLTNRANDQLVVQLTDDREVLAAPFNLPFGHSVPAGDYRFDSALVTLQTATSRVLSGSFSVGGGGFYDGSTRSGSAQLTWLPSPHFAAGLGYTHNAFDLPDGSFAARIASASATIAFNAEWAWFNLVQYDNVSRLMGVNSRLRWIPHAGAQAYLVFNSGIANDPVAGWRRQEMSAALSLGYTIRL